MIVLLIVAALILIWKLPSIFATWADPDYIRHLEEMGEFTDRDGKEKR